MGFKNAIKWLEKRIPKIIEKLGNEGKEKIKAGLMGVILLAL
jgi:hypothetical protein